MGSQLKPYQMPNIEGWMGMKDLNWLYRTAVDMESIVEVGCWFGKSTHALLTGCPGKVFAVDHFKGSPSEIDVAHKFAKDNDVKAVFLENCGHDSGYPNIQKALNENHLAWSQATQDIWKVEL